MGAYVFMIFRGDGDLAGLETLIGDDDGAAARAAPSLLPADDPTGRVEVWRDAELVGSVGLEHVHSWGL